MIDDTVVVGLDEVLPDESVQVSYDSVVSRSPIGPTVKAKTSRGGIKRWLQYVEDALVSGKHARCDIIWPATGDTLVECRVLGHNADSRVKKGYETGFADFVERKKIVELLTAKIFAREAEIETPPEDDASIIDDTTYTADDLQREIAKVLRDVLDDVRGIQ